jgi:hypothetical protein
LQFRLRDFKFGHAGGVQTIEALGVVEHRRIPPFLHIGQDVGHTVLDGGIGVGRPVQALGKSGLKAGILRGQAKRLGRHRLGCHGQSFFTAPAKASMMARIGACLSLSAA